MKKIFKMSILLMIVLSLFACAVKNEGMNENTVLKRKKITVAYQYGVNYAPVVLAKVNELIENAYKELTGDEIYVEWVQMNSGADINVGIASNNIDVGFLGVSFALIGIANEMPYKIFTNICGQECGVITCEKNVNSFQDIIDNKLQIAAPSLGSMQYIVLAKSLLNAGFDAHALDSNIVAMKNPDAMTSIISKTISCHLAGNPYKFKELDCNYLHEINDITQAWPKNKTHFCGVVSKKMYNEKPELYNALCNAFDKAVTMINDDVNSVAKIICEFDGNAYEEEIEFLQRGNYTITTSGVMEMADFMYKNGFVDKKFNSFDEVAFDNVVGD